MSRSMNNKEIWKRLADILEKDESGYINFDLGSYEFKEDIPHITWNGRRKNICYIGIVAENSNMMDVCFDGMTDTIAIDINSIDEDELDVLLRDIYYETSVSWDEEYEECFA